MLFSQEKKYKKNMNQISRSHIKNAVNGAIPLPPIKNILLLQMVKSNIIRAAVWQAIAKLALFANSVALS
jgi:hypothetical protein